MHKREIAMVGLCTQQSSTATMGQQHTTLHTHTPAAAALLPEYKICDIQPAGVAAVAWVVQELLGQC
jgi:hypothetical protein